MAQYGQISFRGIEDRVVDEDSDGQETKNRLLQSQIFAYAVLIPFIPSLPFQQNHPQFFFSPQGGNVPCLKKQTKLPRPFPVFLAESGPMTFWPMEGKSGHWMELSGLLFEREQTWETFAFCLSSSSAWNVDVEEEQSFSEHEVTSPQMTAPVKDGWMER